MDATDRRLLSLLRRDGRASYAVLGQQVELSEGAVRARVKRLRDDGILKRFTIRTEGGGVRALIEAQVRGGERAGGPAAAVAAWPEVELVWELTGERDLMVVAELGTPDELNGLIDRMRELPGVTGTRSRLILREH